MPLTNPLVDLANQIRSNATIVSNYLSENGYLQPSFEQDAMTRVLPPEAPQYVQDARVRLRESSSKLLQLSSGANEYLHHLNIANFSIVCFRFLSHFNIFALVPTQSDTTIDYKNLAIAAAVPERTLKHVIRMAMTQNLFREPAPNHVAHSATSLLFATNADFADAAKIQSEVFMPASFRLNEATEKWPESNINNETAYNIEFQTKLPHFDHMSLSPTETENFAGYMRSLDQVDYTSLRNVVRAFDWGSLAEGLVVDVGGSLGHASIALAEAFPSLRFIVQDLPQVIDRATIKLASSPIPDEISTRISFRPHNIFSPQPEAAASIYLIKMVLHDWPDKQVVEILGNLVKVMKPGSRILVVEIVLPETGGGASLSEASLSRSSLSMLSLYNTCERTMEEWKVLFRAADERLVVKNVVQPYPSLHSAIELQLQEG